LTYKIEKQSCGNTGKVLKNNELSLDYFVKEAERELREH
jgi:hypothetical protein